MLLLRHDVTQVIDLKVQLFILIVVHSRLLFNQIYFTLCLLHLVLQRIVLMIVFKFILFQSLKLILMVFQLLVFFFVHGLFKFKGHVKVIHVTLKLFIFHLERAYLLHVSRCSLLRLHLVFDIHIVIYLLLLYSLF